MELAKLSTICIFHGKFGRIPVTRFGVENEIFTVEIAIFIAEMDSGPPLHIDTIPIIEN